MELGVRAVGRQALGLLVEPAGRKQIAQPDGLAFVGERGIDDRFPAFSGACALGLGLANSWRLCESIVGQWPVDGFMKRKINDASFLFRIDFFGPFILELELFQPVYGALLGKHQTLGYQLLLLIFQVRFDRRYA